jgi:hypothetical protein
MMQYSTFTSYVHYFNPGIRLTRAKEDECDSCIRLKLIISDVNSTEEQKNGAQLELDMHNDSARVQRRAISDFTRNYGGTLTDIKKLPKTILLDNIDDDDDINDDTDDDKNNTSMLTQEIVAEKFKLNECEVLFIAEDFGQGIALPHFGYRRPGSDYFNSNLMQHLYVMADISRNEHNVYLYDERLQGKDKDALCSLRMCHHILERQRCLRNNIDPPKYFVSIRDNCVGQNKSNHTFKLECLLSMLFYERVLIVFLIPGHSHMLE